jgi:hypothetical protein
MITCIFKFTAKIIASISLILMITGSMRAQDNELILNLNQPVDLSNHKKIDGIWNIVKISFPDAEIRFVYSFEKVDYYLFDLKNNNSFLVFSSKPDATSFNLKINNLESKEIKFCVVRHTIKGSPEVHNRFFGHLFQLGDRETCEIISEGEYNEGNLIFNLTRDDKGLWLISVIKKKFN